MKTKLSDMTIPELFEAMTSIMNEIQDRLMQIAE